MALSDRNKRSSSLCIKFEDVDCQVAQIPSSLCFIKRLLRRFLGKFLGQVHPVVEQGFDGCLSLVEFGLLSNEHEREQRQKL